MKKHILNFALYGIGVIFLVSAAALFIDTARLNERMANFLVTAGIKSYDEGVEREQMAAVTAVYSQSFQFARSRPETAVTYVPVFVINEAETADGYADKFNVPRETVTETDVSFVYSNHNESLTVYKYISYAVYLNENPLKANGVAVAPQKHITGGQALRIGEEFMRSRGFAMQYSEAVVNEYGGTFVVSYVGKLSGLLNYAFPTVLEIDETGFVTSVEYYFFDYERLAVCSLKTMRQAFYALPTDFPEGTRIDLRRSVMVYFYENSILQPAFLFEGEFENGGTFRAFINAARFG
jgi:hypothetical protein